MEKQFNTIHYKIVQFKLNSESGRYEKQPETISFLKLPFELKVENSQKEFLIQQGANTLITGRFKNKKREFFTGLIPVSTGFYFGNDVEFVHGKKKNSLIVFQFSNNSQDLTVYYFNRFYIDNREARIKFVKDFIVGGLASI